MIMVIFVNKNTAEAKIVRPKHEDNNLLFRARCVLLSCEILADKILEREILERKKVKK